jgi:hypothetical protein
MERIVERVFGGKIRESAYFHGIKCRPPQIHCQGDWPFHGILVIFPRIGQMLAEGNNTDCRNVWTSPQAQFRQPSASFGNLNRKFVGHLNFGAFFMKLLVNFVKFKKYIRIF